MPAVLRNGVPMDFTDFDGPKEGDETAAYHRLRDERIRSQDSMRGPQAPPDRRGVSVRELKHAPTFGGVRVK